MLLEKPYVEQDTGYVLTKCCLASTSNVLTKCCLANQVGEHRTPNTGIDEKVNRKVIDLKVLYKYKINSEYAYYQNCYPWASINEIMKLQTLSLRYYHIR